MKKILFVLLLFALMLSAPLAASAAELSDGSEQVTVTEAGVAEKPEWQRFLEERILPTVGAVASGAGALYILFLPVIKKIVDAAVKVNTASADFDTATGGIAALGDGTRGMGEALEGLRQELEDACTLVCASEERNKELIEVLLRIVSLAFSHEGELVKNGTAREIMKVVNGYVGAEEA